jgi:N-acetylneuraminic acid mutarotase
LPASGVINDKIYVIGGAIGSVTGAISTNEEYDPASNIWASMASMPTNRWNAGAGVVNGKIYIIGGTNGTNLSTNEEYTP